MKRNTQGSSATHGSLSTQELVDMNHQSKNQESVQICTDDGMHTSASLSSEMSSSTPSDANFESQIAQSDISVSQNQQINEAVSQPSSDQSAHQILLCNPLLQNFSQDQIFNQQQFILQSTTDVNGVQNYQVVAHNGNWNGEGIPISFQEFLLLSQIHMGQNKETQDMQQQMLFQQQQQDTLEQVVHEPMLTDSQQFAEPAAVVTPKQLPNLPKKPITAYLLFSTEYWNKHKEKAPSGGVCEIGNKIGEEWRKLPESEKETYKEIYKQRKIAYEKDLEEYCKVHNLLPSELKSIKVKKTKIKKMKTPPTRTNLSVSNYSSISQTSTIMSVSNVTGLNDVTGDIAEFNQHETSMYSYDPMNVNTIEAHSPSTCSATSGTSEMNSQTSCSPALGNMSERSPSVCDQMSDGRRSLPNQLISNHPQQVFHQENIPENNKRTLSLEQILPDIQQKQLVFSSQMQIQQMSHNQSTHPVSNGHQQPLPFGRENVQNCERQQIVQNQQWQSSPQIVQNQQWQSPSQIHHLPMQQQQTSTSQQQTPVVQQQHLEYVMSFGSNVQPDFTLVNMPETVTNCINGQQQFLQKNCLTQQQNNFNHYSVHNQVEQNSQQLPPISTMCIGRQEMNSMPSMSAEDFNRILKERDARLEHCRRVIVNQQEVIRKLKCDNLQLQTNFEAYQKYIQNQNINYAGPHSNR